MDLQSFYTESELAPDALQIRPTERKAQEGMGRNPIGDQQNPREKSRRRGEE